MAEVQRGTLFVAWGIGTVAASGIGTFSPQSGDFKKESKNIEVQNGIGQTINSTFFDQKRTYSLSVIPTATTITLATTANIAPVPGTIVTLTDALDADVSGTNGGKYLCISASKKKSNGAPGEMTFELMQYVDTDIAVASA